MTLRGPKWELLLPEVFRAEFGGGFEMVEMYI